MCLCESQVLSNSRKVIFSSEKINNKMKSCQDFCHAENTWSITSFHKANQSSPSESQFPALIFIRYMYVQKVPEGRTISHVTAVEAFHIQSDSDPYCQFVATIPKTSWKHENSIAAKKNWRKDTTYWTYWKKYIHLWGHSISFQFSLNLNTILTLIRLVCYVVLPANWLFAPLAL